MTRSSGYAFGMMEKGMDPTVALWSEIDVGTEVELRFPATHAYATAQRRR
jgi:hypothetical protein